MLWLRPWGFHAVSPSHPSDFPHHGIQRITVEFSEKSPTLRLCCTSPPKEGAVNNADYRGGVTCLYDTQLPGVCLHASGCGGRSRPQAVRGMPEIPIAPPATGPPERAPGGVGGCRLCQPSLFQQGVVGVFIWGFRVLTSDFGVGKGQDLGFYPF